MATFQVTRSDRTIEIVESADGYQPEGPMTTFYATTSGHGRLDAWATRLASFRSADIVMVRRLPDEAPGLVAVVG